MARYHGKLGMLGFDVAPGTTAANFIALTSWSVNPKAAADDDTGMDSGGAKTFMGGLTEWTGDCAGYWDSTETGLTSTAPAYPDISPGQLLFLKLELEDGGVFYSGNALCTSFKPDVGVGAAIKITVDFQGTGDLTYPAA